MLIRLVSTTIYSSNFFIRDLKAKDISIITANHCSGCKAQELVARGHLASHSEQEFTVYNHPSTEQVDRYGSRRENESGIPTVRKVASAEYFMLHGEQSPAEAVESPNGMSRIPRKPLPSTNLII